MATEHQTVGRMPRGLVFTTQDTPAITSAETNQLICPSVSFMCFGVIRLNPFTPESDQCQIYPAASQEILHHTVRRTWLFLAYSGEKWLYYKFSLHHSYNRFLKGWENTLFELRSERVKQTSVNTRTNHGMKENRKRAADIKWPRSEIFVFVLERRTDYG